MIETQQERDEASNDAPVNDETLLDMYERLKKASENDSMPFSDMRLISPNMTMRLVCDIMRKSGLK